MNFDHPIRRRTVAVGLAATLAVLAVPATAQAQGHRLELPAPTGPYAIGTTELHLVDHARQDPWVAGRKRELMVSIWYPTTHAAHGRRAPYVNANVAPELAASMAGYLGLGGDTLDLAGTKTHARTNAPALGKHPVVLSSSALGASRTIVTYQAEEVASRGYVVVTIDHTYETPVEFPGGRVTGVEAPLWDVTFKDREVPIRVADTGFVLDELESLAAGENPDAEGRTLPHGIGRSLDLRRIAMVGYSLGGFTAGEAMLVDQRIDIGANLDGSMKYEHEGDSYELSEVAKGGLNRPFLLFGAESHSHLPRPGRRLDDPSWTAFWANQRGWKLDLNLPTGTHGAFADHQVLLPQLARAEGVPDEVVTEVLGTVDPARSVRAVRTYVTAYLDRFLKGRPQPLLWGESPRFPEVRFVR